MKRSAGLLLYRHSPNGWQVLLVHPGGPYWARRDEGAWSIPKGEIDGVEAPLDAARREFREETGADVDGEFIALDAVRLASGKRVYAWAVAGDFDPAQLRSNEFEVEWPPKSGKRRRFPEVDRAAWFTLAEAERKIHPGQAPLLARLREALAERGASNVRRLTGGIEEMPGQAGWYTVS
ncbi:MAG: NUDIX domain-containing protein, partial [Burkholderiaceae bacterium]|nr:NUDIX domain-containing protein [Burkholderiaceae bacterium]